MKSILIAADSKMRKVVIGLMCIASISATLYRKNVGLLAETSDNFLLL